MSTATVVIPTIGSDCLDDAIRSVRAQTYPGTRCWVVVDGPEHAAAARRITSQYPDVRVLLLPENVGADGWYGHRVYAAVGYLINTDYLLYLDQDNFYAPDHVAHMIGLIESQGLDWCHSLRNIHDRQGRLLMPDDCESLGRWPAWVNDQVHLVDTSCYCIKRSVAARVSGAWYGQWGQDRVFLATIAQHFPKFGCTGLHTVGYRLDGNPGSVTEDFFRQGNAAMAQRYPAGFPWRR
jgi:glycosyltransferase involved in cell wall biosynthesis